MLGWGSHIPLEHGQGFPGDTTSFFSSFLTKMDVAEGVRATFKDQGLTVRVFEIRLLEAVAGIDGVSFLNGTVRHLGPDEGADQARVLGDGELGADIHGNWDSSCNNWESYVRFCQRETRRGINWTLN